MIQTLEGRIRRFWAYGLEVKDLDYFTYDWCTFKPKIELEYETSVHSSTGKAPAMLEKIWNPRLPEDTLRKDFIEIHPTASSFKIMLDEVKHHEIIRMNDTFEYEKHNWYKSHKLPDFKVGDLGVVSTLNLHNIKGPKKLKYSYTETFIFLPYM
ncbi:hypothetical protein O181_062110 [Austropuccinia psidii MF-1]|uniref:Uncharacterized protein n=1 Tax=Austropuccinia psidii MF-1 TaxID=1389203 RepID=A0A9Q3ENP6_9BASI|nr:hypothetical protein [Austropuccinia psidii MF-1]